MPVVNPSQSVLMLGIGIDIIELSRMRETIQRSGDIFLKRVFSAREIETGKRREDPNSFFASAFAGKEAVFKALTLDWDRGVDFKDIEISRGKSGEPLVLLSGTVRAQAKAKGCPQVLLSLSYETNLAVAMAIAL
jgi:holo-[acyl-carrier protein] synthase